MRITAKDHLILPRKLGDRLFLFFFGLFFAAFFALMGLCMSPLVRETRNEDWLQGCLHDLAVDTMFTFSMFSLLTVVWALFTPRWLESAMSRTYRKVIAAIAVVLVATVFTILYCSLRK